MPQPLHCPSWVIPAERPGAGPAPLLILMHGVGGNETGMIEAARGLDPRFIKLVLRGPLPFGPGAFGWFHVDFTAAGPRHNAAEAEASRRLVAELIPGAVRELGADPLRVYAAGFSQGAIMAMSLLLTRPDLLAGAAAWSGRILPEAVPSGPEAAALGGRAALVVHGLHDQTLPVAHGRASRTTLEGLPLRKVTFHELPIGHGLSGDVLALTNSWLDQELAELR